MSKRATAALFAIALVVASNPACAGARSGGAHDDLTGAWRGRVQFTTGAFAVVKDLQFMYVFNAGGTMTESSNYDAAPPVPPAYGVWKKTGARRYRAKYQFFQSRSVSTVAEILRNGGWMGDGYGVLSQSITLSTDGKSFESTITLELFDRNGKASAGGNATASGTRLSL